VHGTSPKAQYLRCYLLKSNLSLQQPHMMARAFKQDTEHKRHLLRLWVALPEGLACELAPAYTEVYGSTQVSVWKYAGQCIEVRRSVYGSTQVSCVVIAC
jgi:hypothetical protein